MIISLDFRRKFDESPRVTRSGRGIDPSKRDGEDSPVKERLFADELSLTLSGVLESSFSSVGSRSKIALLEPELMIVLYRSGSLAEAFL